MLAIDARRRDGAPASGYDVMIRGGRDSTPREAVAWAREGVAVGAGEILLTSVDRDGTGDGYDLELLAAVASSVNVPVIASGGARSVDDLEAAFAAGAEAALAATIFHDDELSVLDVKRELERRGVPVRVPSQEDIR